MLRASSTKTVSTTTTINTSAILTPQAAGVSTRVARTPRVLKRRHSSPRPVEVRQSVSIDGGYVKKPLTLMTVSFPFSQSPFLALNSTTEWVHQVVAGKCRDAAVSTKIVDVMELARTSVKATSNAARDELGLSDSDGEDSAGGLTASRRKTRAKPTVPRIETNVTIRGCTFGVYFHRKVMYVPATTSDLDALCRAIQEEDGSGAATSKKQRSSQTEDVVGGDAASSGKGKVWWFYGRHTWKIRYLDDKGKYHDYIKGLAPPTQNYAGIRLTHSQYSQAKEEFRIKAVKLWNELDKSDEPRLAAKNREA